MPGYTTYCTTPPAFVRFARSPLAVDAGFLTLIFATGLAFDRLAFVLITVMEHFAK